MTNRNKLSTNRQITNNNKTTNDDDNCSVICYKDFNDGHVGVIRIRQQPRCSACNILRGTLASYYKHIVDKNHRENVKKLCDENRFEPSVYDQAIHLAFQNNFYYQSEKFHFLYKTTNEEIESSENDQMEINNNNDNISQKNILRKRRNFQVTLVFQDKKYSQIGMANAQIREQLLKEMINDRANDLAVLPKEIYYTNKKFASEDIHHNAQKGSVVIPTIKDQTHMMLKEQQQEPFENGQMSSSAENKSEDNGVEHSTAMTTHKISSADILDHNEQSFIINDIACKSVLNDLLQDIYSKSDEFKREQRFLSGLARRSFRKKNTFFCDLCNKFLPTEKHCSTHLNTSEHLEKVKRYQTEFFPWRKAMQKALITGKSMKEILDSTIYDNYKTTMALYLTPNNLCNRGRFCCAYCEMIFTDQWSLEKHLHSLEHQQKKTSDDHKELVVSYANSVNFPIIFKFNGITNLSEIPDDIKTRYQWRIVSRAQLDEDTNSFIRNYPFDTFEGVTRLLSGRAARKQKLFPTKSTIQSTKTNKNNNNQLGKRSGLHTARGGRSHVPVTPRGTVNKRPFPMSAPPNKRFRADLNSSFPGTNRVPRSIRQYDTEQHNYNNQPGQYNNGNNYWPPRHANNHQYQREEYFERSNFDLRSNVSDNNGYYDDRSSYPMSRADNNYNQNLSMHFNNARNDYNNQPLNYDRSFMHPNPQGIPDYHHEQHPSNRSHSHHRSHLGPINEPRHHIPNNLSLPPPPPQQQQRPLMGPMQHQNSFADYGGRTNNNNNSINSSYFPSPNHQQLNPMGTTNGSSIRSYSDYRSSSALANNNTSSLMYSPLPNNQNPIVSHTRTFDEFNLTPLAHNSSNSHGRSGRPPFKNDEGHYGNFGHQSQMEHNSRSSWRGTSRGGNNTHGRGGSSFQSNKQPGATFSYSSQNKNNSSSMRGRGAGRNTRNFGSGR